MARDISVTIAVQGEKEYAQALRDAQSAVKLLESELKASEASFGDNADAQERYANRTRLIGAQIEQQKTILKSLEGAIREASDEFGEGSAKTDKYRIAANRTQASIAQLERSLRETQEEAEELGRDSVRIGRQLEDGIGDAADDVSDKLDRMVRSLESDLGDIGSAVTFSAIVDGARGVGDVISQVAESINEIVEGTEDYRRRMSFLEQNAITAGMDPDVIHSMAIEIASLTGELDGTVEGLSALMATGFDDDELATAIERLSGAVVMFPDTMKFENLAESLQESVAAGNATGAYAELLERMGLNLETVNESLEEAETLEARQTAALAWLSEHGLEGVVENYKAMNEDLIANETAQLKYNESVANLAEALLPTQTAFTNFKTAFVQGTADMINGGFDTAIDNVKTKLEEARTALNDWVNDVLGEETYEKMFGGERKAGTAGEYAGAIPQAVLEPDTTVKPGAYAGAVDLGAVYGEAAGSAYKASAQEKIDETFEGTEQAGTKGAEGAAAYVEAANAAVNELEPVLTENMSVTGENMGIGLNNGLVDQAPVIASTAAAIYSQVEAQLSQEIVIPVSVGMPGWEGTQASSYLTGGSGGNVNLTTNVSIDGRSVGKATSGSVNSDLGAAAQRASTYGR